MTGDIIYKLGGKERIESSYKLCLEWILKSFQSNNNLGSSNYSNLIGQFSTPYLETTGYLIPSLIEASIYFDDDKYVSLGERQVIFLEMFQNEDGSFYQSINSSTPIIFDTAQILLGLCKLYERHATDKILSMISKSTTWLYSLLNEEGKFIKYNYKDQSRPSYYSRVYWPMLLAKKLVGDSEVKKIEVGIFKITESQNQNFSYPNWSFDSNESALTHTIAYTIRGLWECGRLLHSVDIIKNAENSLLTLANNINNEGKALATYDNSWKGDDSYICSAGNAQLAIMLIKSKLSKSISKKAVTTLLRPLLKHQNRSGFNKGAVSSSIPIWGKYQRWRYTNWTQKFFVDALHLLLIDQ